MTGWDGEKGVWSVEDGEIVGKAAGPRMNAPLRSSLEVTDFKLTAKVKLTPNTEDSGIVFRGVSSPDGDVKGPLADVGKGKPGEWNECVVEAIGPRVWVWVNGLQVSDTTDEKVSRR